jgi:hypothetical protein
VRLELGAAILAVLLLAVGSTTLAAASTTAASAASALAGAAVVTTAAATLAVVIVAVATTATASTTAAPSFSFGHVTQSLNLLPATSEESARGRKKEIRMREIEVRHLPAAVAADTHPVKRTRLRRHWLKLLRRFGCTWCA